MILTRDGDGDDAQTSAFGGSDSTSFPQRPDVTGAAAFPAVAEAAATRFFIILYSVMYGDNNNILFRIGFWFSSFVSRDINKNYNG